MAAGRAGTPTHPPPCRCAQACTSSPCCIASSIAPHPRHGLYPRQHMRCAKRIAAVCLRHSSVHGRLHPGGSVRMHAAQHDRHSTEGCKLKPPDAGAGEHPEPHLCGRPLLQRARLRGQHAHGARQGRLPGVQPEHQVCMQPATLESTHAGWLQSAWKGGRAALVLRAAGSAMLRSTCSMTMPYCEE